MSTPHSTADELEQLADELDSLAAALASTPPRFELGPMVRDELAEYEQRANRIGYPSIADGISRAKKRTPVSGAGEALRDVATHARQLAAERRQTANDDDRRAVEGDEQRDYAEERYNAALLVDPDELAERIAAGFNQATDDPEPVDVGPVGIGAALTLDQLTADELESYAKTTPALVPAVLRELVARARQLERLAELALSPMMHAETVAAARVQRMKQRPAGSHAPDVIAEAELEWRAAGVAVVILRENSATRRKIVRRLEAGK